MTYSIRQATAADIPHLVEHREQMFREMGIAAEWDGMRTAFERWLRDAIPANTYLGWVAVASNGDVAGGGGLIVMPWPPGPVSMDPRCGFVFNVYTEPAPSPRPRPPHDGRDARVVPQPGNRTGRPQRQHVRAAPV